MKITIAEQAHELRLKIKGARVTIVQQVTPTVDMIKIEFLATHRVATQTIVVDEIEETQEIHIPLSSPIIAETVHREVSWQLMTALRQAITTPEILPVINEQLAEFNSLFTGSMEGFQLEVITIEMG